MLARTELDHSMHPLPGSPPVRWRISEGLVSYEEAVQAMEAEVAAIADDLLLPDRIRMAFSRRNDSD